MPLHMYCHPCVRCALMCAVCVRYRPQKGGDKRMPAEVFEQYDIDGDGVLSKDEFTKAKAKFRSHENRRR